MTLITLTILSIRENCSSTVSTTVNKVWIIKRGGPHSVPGGLSCFASRLKLLLIMLFQMEFRIIVSQKPFCETFRNRENFHLVFLPGLNFKPIKEMSSSRLLLFTLLFQYVVSTTFLFTAHVNKKQFSKMANIGSKILWCFHKNLFTASSKFRIRMKIIFNKEITSSNTCTETCLTTNSWLWFCS